MSAVRVRAVAVWLVTGDARKRGQELQAGDGGAIASGTHVEINATEENVEFLFFDLAGGE